MSTLRTEGLTKSYGGRTVVRGVSLEVSSGEVVGLLGPNGAGKTTTFYMTVGLTTPDSGRVLLDCFYVRQLATNDLRHHVGFVLHEPFLFRGTLLDNLTYGRPEATAEEAISAALAATAAL